MAGTEATKISVRKRSLTLTIPSNSQTGTAKGIGFNGTLTFAFLYGTALDGGSETLDLIWIPQGKSGEISSASISNVSSTEDWFDYVQPGWDLVPGDKLRLDISSGQDEDEDIDLDLRIL